MSVFQSIPEQDKLYQGQYFFVIKDRFPVSEGHCLIISNEQKENYFDLSDQQKQELIKIIDLTKSIIEKDYSPDGYNIGMNCGKAAGQTVMHFHCHVIPRYFGDMKNPKGGVRHCVEGKGYY